MFLIVLGHAMFHGHVLQALTPNSVNDCMTSVLRAFLSVHVNCFVLLSGYFLCTQEFRPVRFLAGFFLVGCIVSAALHRRRSVRRQDVFEGLPSIYTEKILVCHDLSSDVCAGAASECRGPCYEPAPARGVSCSFFHHLYCASKSVLLGAFYRDRQLRSAFLCIFVYDRGVFPALSCQKNAGTVSAVVLRRVPVCRGVEACNGVDYKQGRRKDNGRKHVPVV